MNGFPVAPAAVPHGFFLRPSEMIGEGSEAAAQTVQADLREIVCGTDPVDLPPHAVAERAYITVVILQDFQKPGYHDGDDALRAGALVLFPAYPFGGGCIDRSAGDGDRLGFEIDVLRAEREDLRTAER